MVIFRNYKGRVFIIKKLTAVFFMMLLFSACGSGEPAQFIPSAQTSPSNTSDRSSEVSLSSKSNPSIESVETYSFSALEFAETYKTPPAEFNLPDFFANEPIINYDDSELFGPMATYTYELFPGAACVLYENTNSNKMFNCYVTGDSTLMSESDQIVFRSFLKYFISIFALSDQADDMIKDLQMDLPFSEELYNDTDGKDCEINYICVKGKAVLNFRNT